MDKLNELLERENTYKNHYGIKRTENGYVLTEQDSHYSDSCNPNGEWFHYESEIKTYKTLRGAVNALRNLVSCHFPTGYNIDGIVEAIVQAIEPSN